MGMNPLISYLLGKRQGDKAAALLKSFVDRSITAITVPDDWTVINYYAFANCYHLASVVFGENSHVASVGMQSFMNAQSLSTVDLPDTVATIEDGAFLASGLTSINLPPNVTSLGSRSFGSCPRLTSVHIGSAITSINSMCFTGSSNLTLITIDKAEGSIAGEPWGADNAVVTWLEE